jgi:hypothetical protein
VLPITRRDAVYRRGPMPDSQPCAA